MDEKMKTIGRKMSIRMGILMSFCLALVGTLTSGHFTPVGFLISFVVSTIASLLIGFLVPVGKVSAGICKKCQLAPETLPNRIVSTLISDIIYTPIITLVMTALAYKMAMIQSGGMAQIEFAPMFFKSFAICFPIGFVLIFIFMPLFLKQLLSADGKEAPRR